MKTSTASNTLGIARTGMAVAAFTLASCAADDLASEQRMAAQAETPSTTSADQACAGQQAHTLFLEDADGQPFRLVHIAGCGWKQIAGAKSPKQSLALPKMSIAPISAARADTVAETPSDPLTVFIDGPTGYTFVWTAENGWKFVGYLRDGAR